MQTSENLLEVWMIDDFGDIMYIFNTVVALKLTY